MGAWSSGQLAWVPSLALHLLLLTLRGELLIVPGPPRLRVGKGPREAWGRGTWPVSVTCPLVVAGMYCNLSTSLG